MSTFKRKVDHMNKRFLIVFVFIIVSSGHTSGSYGQVRRNVSPSTFLKSDSAIIRLGVWDKFGAAKNYTANFVVTAPTGKQHKAQKHVVADEGWVYVDFPNDFGGGAPDYSTYATYQWKCLVGGKEVATGQFQWGGSRASTGSIGSVAGDIDEMTPRRETLKRRDAVPNDLPAEVKPKAVTQSQDWNSFWNAFRNAVGKRDRAALRMMMASSFEYGDGERVSSERVFSELDYSGGENWRVLERTLNRAVQPHKLPGSTRPSRVVKNPLPCGKRPCDYTAWAIFELGTDERWRWVSFIFPGD